MSTISTATVLTSNTNDSTNTKYSTYQQLNTNANTAYNIIQSMLTPTQHNTHKNSLGELFQFTNRGKFVYDVNTGLIQTQHNTDCHSDDSSTKRRKLTAASSYDSLTSNGVSIHSDSCNSNDSLHSVTLSTHNSIRSAVDKTKQIQLYTPTLTPTHDTFNFTTDTHKLQISDNTAFTSYNTERHSTTTYTKSHNKPLHNATTHLCDLYHKCNDSFNYTTAQQPRRILTEPNQRCLNNNHDNAQHNLIVSVGDIIQSEHNTDTCKYRVVELLGTGTFGLVVRCINVQTQQYVALKIVKNKPAYTQQAVSEIKILVTLKQLSYNDNTVNSTLQLQDYFMYQNHVCLVFELLSINLYDLIKQNNFRGLNLSLIRTFTVQLVHTLVSLKSTGIVHADIKPENILLCNIHEPNIKLIDYGSACIDKHPVYSYIQSRFYRAPEVLLGTDYGCEIDVWSLACVICELYLGLPLFPGLNQYNQLERIVNVIGMPPASYLQQCKHTNKYFNSTYDVFGLQQYTFKTQSQYVDEQQCKPVVNKIYFAGTTIHDIITMYPYKQNLTPQQLQQETLDRQCLIHFITGCLRWKPAQRFTPVQLLHHPFITRQPFDTVNWHAFDQLKYHSMNICKPPVCLTDTNHSMWHNDVCINTALPKPQKPKSTFTTPVIQPQLSINTNMSPLTSSQNSPTNITYLPITLPNIQTTHRQNTMPLTNTFMSPPTSLPATPTMQRRRTANDIAQYNKHLNELHTMQQQLQQLSNITQQSLIAASPLHQSIYLQQNRLPMSRAAVMQQLTPLNSPYLPYMMIPQNTIPSIQLSPVQTSQQSTYNVPPAALYHTTRQSSGDITAQQTVLKSSNSADSDISETSKTLNTSFNTFTFDTTSLNSNKRNMFLHSNCVTPQHRPPLSPNKRRMKCTDEPQHTDVCSPINKQ